MMSLVLKNSHVSPVEEGLAMYSFLRTAQAPLFQRTHWVECLAMYSFLRTAQAPLFQRTHWVECLAMYSFLRTAQAPLFQRTHWVECLAMYSFLKTAQAPLFQRTHWVESRIKKFTPRCVCRYLELRPCSPAPHCPAQRNRGVPVPIVPHSFVSVRGDQFEG